MRDLEIAERDNFDFYPEDWRLLLGL